MLKLFFKLIFENPYPFIGGWLGDHVLYAHIENQFKHVHEKGGREYELYTWSLLCFQLVSQLISILYTHIYFYICMLQLQIVSISIGIYSFIHIYVFWLCLLYLYILEYKFYYAKLDLVLNVNYFSIGISYKLMHHFH